MSKDDISDDNNPSTQSNTPSYDDGYQNQNKTEQDMMRLWGILIFGVIGATATTFAINQLRRSSDLFYSQFSRSQSSYRGTTGGSSRSSFQEEARKRYAQRMQEEYEEEIERVERIRRMQSVFNREKNKYRRGYERWSDDSSDGYQQPFQRDDWYWKTETMYGNRSNFKEPPQAPANYSLSHHYAILGLSRSRTNPYTDDEIKMAFRNKAKQYHPDQNQENKEFAEARFKEVMSSYEAIKAERKNIKKKEMEFKSCDVNLWKEALSAYETRINSMDKPNLPSLDRFYCKELPPLLHQRNPNPHITTTELSKLMQWKLTRGKWRPRLLDFVSSLDEDMVKSASEKAFKSLPDVSKAISELTVLKGVGPATASAVLAAYAPHLAPFMSDEAMVAALGNSKQYTLKQYLVFVDKLEAKAKELSGTGEEVFTASDVERALWSCAKSKNDSNNSDDIKSTKKKRKR
ncbi:hypothetical protein L6452_35108 [Arctium lappa]|uniref:Uncharacterized protein n=1 Tax=Arctium lappa TaxID=4217 RepID=A0ACB8YK05_ARCLA|nr:hypothetical protein L6452_35108 [Arctium lappa]